MALDALMVVTNPSRRKKRFTLKQRRAQALFAKRAKSGAFKRRNTKLTASQRRAAGWKTSFKIRSSYTGGVGKSGWSKPKRYSSEGEAAHSAFGRRAYITPKSRRRKNKWSRAPALGVSSTAGKLSTTSHFVGAKLRRRPSPKKNPKRSAMAFRRKNKFRKGRKSRKAKLIAKKFWRSARGRKWRAARRRGLSLKAAWRLVKSGGTTTKRRRRRGASPKKRKSVKRSRAARAAWGRRKARAGGYEGPMFLNPRRRRRKSRKGRRRARRGKSFFGIRLNPRRRRRYRRLRRALYVRRNRRRGRRRPGRSRRGRFMSMRRYSRRSRRTGRFFSGRRSNPGLWLLKPAVAGLAGLGATRVIPRLVASFLPEPVSMVTGALGDWAGVLLSGASLFVLAFATRKVSLLNRYKMPLLIGGGIGVLSEVAQRLLPAEWLAAIGLAPSGGYAVGSLPVASDETGSLTGYVPEQLGAYVPESLGAYVPESLGLEVTEALGSMADDCPGCAGNPHGAPRSAYGRSGAIVPQGGAGGIFMGNTFSGSTF